MAISGQWNQATGASALAGYTGPLQWGTGYNPVHNVQGQAVPGRIIDPNATGQTPVPEDLESSWDYTPGDYYGSTEDLSMRALPDELSNSWDKGIAGSLPPGNYPSHDEDATGWRGIPHRSGEEAGRTPEYLPDFSSSGHYRSKGYLGIVATSVESDPSQYVISTSDVQGPGKKSLDNSRAVARDTDEPRSAITSRVRGQRLRQYAHGAPGPDMFPYQQDLIIRPFIGRHPGMSVPPPGGYTYMEPSAFEPIQYSAPADPYQGEPPADYGNSPEDVFY